MMRKILGRLELSGPRTKGLLLWERNDVRNTNSFHELRAAAGVRSVLPFDEVTQKVKCMDGLLFVLFEWEPAEPMRKDLVSVDALGPKPHELPDGRDAVLCGVDVLLRPRVGCLDDSNQQGERLCNQKPNQLTGTKNKETNN